MSNVGQFEGVELLSMIFNLLTTQTTINRIGTSLVCLICQL